jgi:putative membrane protein
MKRKSVFGHLTMALALVSILFSGPVFAQKKKASKLSDAEIASVAVSANQIDIQAAQLAQKKSKNADVRSFAKTMIADHQSVIDKATALVTKLGVTPKDNAVSRQLQANAKKTMARLQAKSGTAFDKAYVQNEVAYHKAVIAAVDNTLIPDAQNAELKSLLQSVSPVLHTHLEHAQMVEKNLK